MLTNFVRLLTLSLFVSLPTASGMEQSGKRTKLPSPATEQSYQHHILEKPSALFKEMSHYFSYRPAEVDHSHSKADFINLILEELQEQQLIIDKALAHQAITLQKLEAMIKKEEGRNK